MVTELKEGDTRPPIILPARYHDGEPVDLEAANSITFTMADRQGNVELDDVSATYDPDKTEKDEDNNDVKNYLRYNFAAGDTNGLRGRYEGEFQVEINGETLHFPKNATENIQIQFDRELG